MFIGWEILSLELREMYCTIILISSLDILPSKSVSNRLKIKNNRSSNGFEKRVIIPLKKSLLLKYPSQSASNTAKSLSLIIIEEQ